MYLFIKRLIDILLSLIALLLISPLLIPIIILLKLTGEGEIWYFQERVGYKNKPFKIFKFATMLKNSANIGSGIITTKNDPRITPMGGFLRKSKINELPQLINILIGDMTIVGPRPVMFKSFEAYPEEIQSTIYNVKPGLTGIGSIVFRDEEKLITHVKESGGDEWEFYKNKIYPYKGQLELWYQENASLLTDIKLFFITAWVVLFPSSEIHKKLCRGLPEREW